MFLVIAILLNIFFISVGLYYKKENNINESEYETHRLYQKYIDLRYEYPSIYYRKISKICKKASKGKKIKPYEKKLIKRYLQEHMREEIDKGNDVEVYQTLLEDNSLDDDELISAFFTNEDSNTDNSGYNEYIRDYNEEDNSMMFFNDNDENIKSRNVSLPDKLTKYCENLTLKKFKYNPAIGREKELEDLMITILTPGKSALLLGKARSWKNCNS